MTAKSDDIELVQQAAKGNREAFRILVEKYQSRLLTLAQEIVRSREEAEDVVQESFVKAYVSLHDFKGESSFFTWMYRITYNMAIDFRRKSSRRGGDTLAYEESASSQEEHPATSVFMGSLESPDDVVTRREQGLRLRQALDSLSEEHRAVIMLREIDGLSYAEIAKISGVSEGTVMSRLHYARKKLQGILQDFAPVVRQRGETGSISTQEESLAPHSGALPGPLQRDAIEGQTMETSIIKSEKMKSQKVVRSERGIYG